VPSLFVDKVKVIVSGFSCECDTRLLGPGSDMRGEKGQTRDLDLTVAGAGLVG